MQSYSDPQLIERAQPWLGTLVSIRVGGLPNRAAHLAIDKAFGEIAVVHRCMSFHQLDSDVSRLNRITGSESLAVHPYTFEVLQWALNIAQSSSGCFDVSVGKELVDWGLLPHPEGLSAYPAGCRPKGNSFDIELLPECRVRFHRPLWIDLGGIAKGYAVDRAIDSLRASGAASALVNAGGDIRVAGEHAECIGLELELPSDPVPVVELQDGSIAGSSGHRNRCANAGTAVNPHVLGPGYLGPHLHGTTRSPASTSRFVCVLAAQCVVADALTKVVMAEGSASAHVLQRFGAAAYFHDPLEGWRYLDGGLAN